METFSLSHRRLQIFCAGFWETAEDCQLILNDIGADNTRISLSEPSIQRWFRIINELIRKDDGSMARLVIVLMRDYPNNKALRDVCAPWIPASPMQAPPADKPAPIPVGAVLVKEFVEDELDALPSPAKKKAKHVTSEEVIPLVASADFADEADLVIPKIQTLWDAMTSTGEQMQKIIERLDEMDRWRNVPAERKKKTS